MRPLLIVGSVLLGVPGLCQAQQFSGDFTPQQQERQTLSFRPEGDHFAATVRADLKQGAVNFKITSPDGTVLSNQTARIASVNSVFPVRVAGSHILEVTPREAVGHWEARISAPAAGMVAAADALTRTAASRLIYGQLLSGSLVVLIAISGVGIWARITGTPLRWFAAGAAIWAVGVFLKFTAHSPLNSWYTGLAGRQKTVLELLTGSTYAGLMTGVFEIGTTVAAAFLWRRLAAEPKRAIAVGVGVGSFEALLLGTWALAFSIAALAGKPNIAYWRAIASTVASAPLFWLVSPVERVITIACHIASRTLVLRAVAGHRWWGYWAGFALLSGVDSVAGAVFLSGLLNSRSVWWAELACLPFALLSWPLTRWAATHWPLDAAAREVPKAKSAASRP